ncbi:MAG: hypothetical protein ORN28_11560, partial [Rhodoferax sp.]|nr:hypothetical protein [Rhodoferax sp.]
SGSGSGSNLTDADFSSVYNSNAVSSGNWLQADLGGYYSVSRVQLMNTDASASNQTVSLSTNDMGADRMGVADLQNDATAINLNTGLLGNNSTLTLLPGLGTDDSTPTLQGTLASSAGLASGTEYAVYSSKLDDASPATPTRLTGTFSAPSGSTNWSFTPSTALADGRYAFTLVQQSTGNTVFSNASVQPSASSLILTIDTAIPTLQLGGSPVASNTRFDSHIGSINPLTLSGSPANSYVDLPDVLLSGDLTLQAWVNFSTLFNGERVFEIGNGRDDTLILDVQADGRVSSSIRRGLFPTRQGELEYVDALTSTLDATRPALVTGNWYHLALVVSGNTQTVYV